MAMSQVLKFPVFGINRHRLNSDGSGVTTLVGVSGCPLCCKYCINPECRDKSYLTRDLTVNELIDVVRVDDLYFRATNGGVTFGGGEPLLRNEFIRRFRESCPEEWSVNVETSLNVPNEMLRNAIESIDCLIVDCKDMSHDIYERYTGQPNDNLVFNLNYLAKCGFSNKTIVRIPLIDGYNTPDDQNRSKKTLSDMGFSRFDLFSYIIP